MTKSHDPLSFVDLPQVLRFSQPIHGGITMNIIFLLIIMIITCNGCDLKTFKNSHGLLRHRTSCLAAKEHSAYLAQKHLNLQKVGNGGKKILGPPKDTGTDEQQQEVAENVSYTQIY